MPSPACYKGELGGAGEAGQASVLELVFITKSLTNWIWFMIKVAFPGGGKPDQISLSRDYT